MNPNVDGGETGITDEMRSLVRESLPDLDRAGIGALVPLQKMAPHYISYRGDHPENGLVKLFSLEESGKEVFVYLRQN